MSHWSSPDVECQPNHGGYHNHLPQGYQQPHMGHNIQRYMDTPCQDGGHSINSQFGSNNDLSNNITHSHNCQFRQMDPIQRTNKLNAYEQINVPPPPPLKPNMNHFHHHDKRSTSSFSMDRSTESNPHRNLTSNIHHHNKYHNHRNGVGRIHRSNVQKSQSGENNCCSCGNCQTCMSRVPFATLIATIMCVMGVGVFCGTMYRGSTTTLRMFEDVFKIKVKWDGNYRVEPVQLTFMTVGAVMGGLGLMILFVGCLSTGDTRAKVYRTWRGRVGGRISCAVFMTIAYILTLIWILILCFLIFVTLLYTLAWLQCTHLPKEECIDYNQFGFLFPEGTLEEDKRICPGEKKIFCKDHVNNAEVIFIVATLSAFLVILSLIHYLMCLSANYAHIKSQEKFSELQDLQDMQFLNESEMSTLPKDRF